MSGTHGGARESRRPAPTGASAVPCRPCAATDEIADGPELESDAYADSRSPLHDFPGNGGCGDGIGRRKIELSRSRAARKVPVDRGDRDLALRARDARARVDAGAARRLDERRAHVGENPIIALLLAVLEDLARPALDVAAHTVRHVLVPLQR